MGDHIPTSIQARDEDRSIRLRSLLHLALFYGTRSLSISILIEESGTLKLFREPSPHHSSAFPTCDHFNPEIETRQWKQRFEGSIA